MTPTAFFKKHFLALSVVLSWVPGAPGNPPSPDVTEPPAAEAFLVIPIRLHVLSSTDLPELNCRLTDADLTRILRKVNRIWNNAGIHWGLESIVREPAVNTERFRLIRALGGPVPLGRYGMIVPDDSRLENAINVYFIHEFPVNGVWMGADFAIVQDKAKLQPVEGGIDEPIPRVTAHELGHALGLAHRQDRTNLLASGKTGTRLNAQEVATARAGAILFEGTLTVAELQKLADADGEQVGDQAEAGRTEGQGENLGKIGTRRFKTWLAEIPKKGTRDAVEGDRQVPNGDSEPPAAGQNAR